MNAGQMVNYVKNVTWKTVRYIEADLAQKDKFLTKQTTGRTRIYIAILDDHCVSNLITVWGGKKVPRDNGTAGA